MGTEAGLEQWAQVLLLGGTGGGRVSSTAEMGPPPPMKGHM